MAKQVKLSAERRTGTGRSAVRKIKAHGARAGGHLRRQGQSPKPLQVSRRDITALLSHASGENILVELEIEGEKAGASRSCRKCSTPRSGATFCMSIFMPFRWTK